MPAPVGFSVSNDIAMAKDKQKRRKRKKKLRSFLEYSMVKKSTGLTSVPMSTILDSGVADQAVVHTFKGSNPATVPQPESEFVTLFGGNGWGQDHLPPQNYSIDSLKNKKKKLRTRKNKLKKLLRKP